MRSKFLAGTIFISLKFGAAQYPPCKRSILFHMAWNVFAAGADGRPYEGRGNSAIGEGGGTIAIGGIIQEVDAARVSATKLCRYDSLVS